MTLTESTILREIKDFCESKCFSVDTAAIALTYFYRVLAFTKSSHSEDHESLILAQQLKDRSALKCAAYFCIDFAQKASEVAIVAVANRVNGLSVSASEIHSGLVKKVFKGRWPDLTPVTFISLTMGAYPVSDMWQTEIVAMRTCLDVLATLGNRFRPSILAAACLYLAAREKDENDPRLGNAPFNQGSQANLTCNSIEARLASLQAPEAR